tara:strand:- start:7468 stop:8262 length:795 start_codon:yes stop_codon:yes gene_type:complete
MTNKSIALFDMDGTLTPPRGKAEDCIIRSLVELSQHCDIGILTGSDLDYVMQQLPQIEDLANQVQNSIDILPCNGTKRFTISKSGKFEQQNCVNMLDVLGRDTYNKILVKCCEWQSEIMRQHNDLSFTGTFIQYRGSLINWCPIGRNAGEVERKEWEDFDSRTGTRVTYQDKLQGVLSDWGSKVTVALGGSTSFDIYPDGWDKTYGLTYYGGYDAYFVGDRCRLGGNDWHIYEKLSKVGNAYETTGPDQTLDIIRDIINRVSKM